MNILFYGTKKYDEEFFDAILPEYPELSIHYLEANLSPETAALAAGYEAICAFVNANIGAKTVEQLHRQGVKLILMRCAGYNNVDLKKTAEYGIKVARVYRATHRKPLQSMRWHWRSRQIVIRTRLISSAEKMISA